MAALDTKHYHFATMDEIYIYIYLNIREKTLTNGLGEGVDEGPTVVMEVESVDWRDEALLEDDVLTTILAVLHAPMHEKNLN